LKQLNEKKTLTCVDILINGIHYILDETDGDKKHLLDIVAHHPAPRRENDVLIYNSVALKLSAGGQIGGKKKSV
jgi:hypothetical protein